MRSSNAHLLTPFAFSLETLLNHMRFYQQEKEKRKTRELFTGGERSGGGKGNTGPGDLDGLDGK